MLIGGARSLLMVVVDVGPLAGTLGPKGGAGCMLKGLNALSAWQRLQNDGNVVVCLCLRKGTQSK